MNKYEGSYESLEEAFDVIKSVPGLQAAKYDALSSKVALFLAVATAITSVAIPLLLTHDKQDDWALWARWWLVADALLYFITFVFAILVLWPRQFQSVPDPTVLERYARESRNGFMQGYVFRTTCTYRKNEKTISNMVWAVRALTVLMALQTALVLGATALILS